MTDEAHRDIDLRTQTEGVVVHDSEWVRLDEPVYPVAVKPYRGLLAFFPVGAQARPQGQAGLLTSGKKSLRRLPNLPHSCWVKKRCGHR